MQRGAAGRVALGPWLYPWRIAGGWWPPGARWLGHLPAGRGEACPPLPESAGGVSVSLPFAAVPAAPSSQWSSQRFPGRCRGFGSPAGPPRGKEILPCPGRARERGEWPPGGQLPCRRIAGIPAEQAWLAVADPTLLLPPARLPLPLRPAWAADGTDLVTSAGPGADPLPGGSPTVFGSPQLCPDPSIRPHRCRASLAPCPCWGGGWAALPGPYRPPYPPGWLLAPSLIRCGAASLPGLHR